MRRSIPLLALTAAMLAGSASAHISVQPGAAPGGGYQVLHFGVGHGCDGRDTTEISVAIPAGVDSAHPQPKPGWTLRIDHQGERVTTVTWSGRLPADQFDEFLILAKLPKAGGKLAFPAIQTCRTARIRWTGEEAQRPAPSIDLAGPPETEDSHEHHH